MGATLKIAIYAAAVSIMTALWTIARDVVLARRRIRVTLEMGNAASVNDQLTQVMLNVRATNTSRSHNVGAHTILFAGSRLRWDTPEMAGGVRPANRDDPLPALLTPVHLRTKSPSSLAFVTFTLDSLDDSGSTRSTHCGRSEERTRKRRADHHSPFSLAVATPGTGA